MKQSIPRDTIPDVTTPPAEVIAIRPGGPLEGTVTVDGAKNAALPVLAAAAVVSAPMRVTNIPDSTDVHTLLGLLPGAGFDVVRVPGEMGSMTIAPGRTHRVEAEPLTAASTIRASYYLAPALLGRYGKARLPWPGGCRIGDRGMEQHFRVYEAFGDRCSTHRYGYEIQRSRTEQGTVSVALPFRSRGATIVAILRAVVSRQELRLSTPNLSPETLGVVEALGSIGWTSAVERELLVLTPPTGAPAVHDLAWTVPGDKVEASTLACAVAATRGTVRIEGMRAGDLTPVLEPLRRTGVVVTEHLNGVEIDAREIGDAEQPIHASTSLSPNGLDADFEPSLLAFALGIPGHHAFADTINPGRHANLVPQLRCMGAEIEEVSPTQCRFTGPQRLTGAGVETTDIRTGAALLIAGLAARGITTLGGLEQLRRGHADLPGKLRALGADICEVTLRSGLQQIVATTDFHSSFDDAVPLMSYLSAARPSALIVDSGDFFEGTGYYRLGHGTPERATLLALYDVVAPGNHGWPHYLEPELHRITVCANAHASDGSRLFRPVAVRSIGGRTVAITGVIGIQAFNAIPYGQRAGHQVTDPVLELRELRRAYGEVDAWVVLSHSGFEEDLRLADACPFLDIVFAGHCHSDAYGPVRISGVQVLKGYEQGAGFAQARPSESGWETGVARFTDVPSLSLPSSLEAVRTQITAIARDLREPIDKLRAPYRHTVLDRRLLLEDIATTVYSETSSAVLLNETALRAVQLHGTLTRGDVLAVEPFDNQLVRVNCPERTATSLLSDLSAIAGPMVAVPSPLPSPLEAFITTDYLAGALRLPAVPIGRSLAQSVQQALTGGTR